MINKTIIGRSFGGCVRYQFEGHKDKGEEKRAEILEAVGVRTDNPTVMTTDFNRGRLANPDLGRAVWHTSVSFNPDDAPKVSNELMLAVAREYVAGMGLDRTQYVIIRHHDQPHPHFHLIANRVDDAGKTISDSQNYYRSQKLLNELAHKYELTPVAERRAEKQRPKQLHGADLTRHQIRQAISEVLPTSHNAQELREQLKAKHITFQTRQNAEGKNVGIKFAKDGLTFKGSEIDRKFSHEGIITQLKTNHSQQKERERIDTLRELEDKITKLLNGIAVEAPELTPVERKWQEAYQDYSEPLKAQNEQIRVKNEGLSRVEENLAQNPTLPGVRQAVASPEVQAHYYLKVDLEEQIKTHEAHHRSVAWVAEQRQVLEEQAQERRLFGLGSPTSQAQEAIEKLSILNEPPHTLPDKHYDFALKARPASEELKPFAINVKSYQQDQKPVASLGEYAQQREETERRRERDRNRNRSKGQDKGQDCERGI